MKHLMDNTEEVGKDDEMKRRHLLGISDLSDDVIGEVFKFIGRGHFLFVAGTSRQFYRVYGTTCENENNTTETTVPLTTTKLKSAVESISRLQLS